MVTAAPRLRTFLRSAGRGGRRSLGAAGTGFAAAALAAGLLLVASGARGQELDRHGIFLDTVDVNLINIEVMAVDADGMPVTGLTLEDFEIYEDDELIEITNFFAVENGARVLAPVDRPAPSAATEAAAVEPPPPPTPGERRYVVLFVDQGAIAPNHRRRVFAELRKSLDKLMGPADKVLVVSQDGRISIEQPFTDDPALIEAALGRMESVAGRGILRNAEPRVILREIERGAAPQGADVLAVGDGNSGSQQRRDDIDARATFSRVTGYAQVTQVEVRRTLVALRHFVDSLAGLGGRKAIVYVSDGLELSPGEFLFRTWDYKYESIAQADVGIGSIDAEIGRYDLSPEFRQLVADANANRVAFYTIQGGDSQLYGSLSAESRSPVVAPLARGADGERQESLRALAFDTGGMPLLNAGSVQPLLEQLERDFSSYYSLGYPSPHRGDGKYHRVEVRCKRPGIKVRYLEGYRDKDSDDRMTDRTLASLFLDIGDNPLEVAVEVDAKRQRKAAEGPGWIVPVLVTVPLSKLVLIPQDEAHLGRLSIFLAVKDHEGRTLEPHKIDVPVRIPNDQLFSAMSQKAAYIAELQMRGGKQKVAVGVRDEIAAVGSTLNIDLEVGDR